jgi:HEAT repeat protein
MSAWTGVFTATQSTTTRQALATFAASRLRRPAGFRGLGALSGPWGIRTGDRGVQAAKTLGRLWARESIPALRATAKSGKDVYLRAAALRSLIDIEGARPLRPWLERLSRDAPFNLRNIALRALEDTADEPG